MKIKETIALVSGSFDPFTNAHLEMVRQASEIFDKVYVVIFTNSAKVRTFDSKLMVEAIKKTIGSYGLDNCTVDVDYGLLTNYCNKHNIRYNVRGIRNNIDHDYEESLVEVNKLHKPDLKTIYLRGDGTQLSSTAVRELNKYNEDVSRFVPRPIYDLIMQSKERKE